MVIVDAECMVCGKVREVDMLVSGGLECPIIHYCSCSDKAVEHKRKWTSVHTGPMSNGEPPR